MRIRNRVYGIGFIPAIYISITVIDHHAVAVTNMIHIEVRKPDLIEEFYLRIGETGHICAGVFEIKSGTPSEMMNSEKKIFRVSFSTSPCSGQYQSESGSGEGRKASGLAKVPL
jgi:hypothetical protein